MDNKVILGTATQRIQTGQAPRPLRAVLALSVALLLLAAFTPAVTAQPATTATRVLRIGHIQGDPETQLGGDVFQALRDYLLASPRLLRAMSEAGIDDIAVLSSDSHQDLIQRMDENEFDIVFCSSVDFVSQAGDYEALFQLRRPHDSFDPGGGRVFHRGVIFVNNRSRVFQGDTSATTLADYFSGREVAMVGSFSAAGYIYPRLRIAALPGTKNPPVVVFCDSSEEVVKYVMNGVVEAGACDAGVIEQVLARNGLEGEADKLVRVVLETDPIPTDPVAVREKWLPRTSALGRELRDSLRDFFVRSPNLPRLQGSSREKFGDLKDNMRKLRTTHPN